MIETNRDGQVIFRMHCPAAQRVEIRGSFTGWHDRPIVMLKDADGWWTGIADLEPGDHEFQYLVDSCEWRADYAASGLRMNEFGTWVSLLHVPKLVVRVEVATTGRAKVA